MNRLIALLEPESKVQTRVAAAAVLLAVLGLGHELARLTWLAWPEPGTDEAPLRAPAPSGADAAPESDPGRLASLHLFGEAEPETPPRQAAPIDAPETDLNLQLRGVLFNDRGQMARAIIAAGGNADRLYRIGATLPGGATVEEIYPDQVILLRNGQHEALRLPEQDLDAGAVQTTSQSSARAPDTDDTGGAPARPEGSTDDDRGLAAYRQQLMQDPAAVRQMLQPLPETDASGNLTGFRIQGGGDPRLLEAAGLEPNDLITSVDGTPLDSEQAATEAMERIATADRITLTIDRDGEERRVVLDFES